MSRIIIEATTSNVAKESVFTLINGGFKPTSALVNYNFRKGLPRIEDIKTYPLILEGMLEGRKIEVYVFSVSAGYGGTGPHTLVEILNYAGFHFEEKDILTERASDSKGNIRLSIHL